MCKWNNEQGYASAPPKYDKILNFKIQKKERQRKHVRQLRLESFSLQRKRTGCEITRHGISNTLTASQGRGTGIWPRGRHDEAVLRSIQHVDGLAVTRHDQEDDTTKQSFGTHCSYSTHSSPDWASIVQRWSICSVKLAKNRVGKVTPTMKHLWKF